MSENCTPEQSKAKVTKPSKSRVSKDKTPDESVVVPGCIKPYVSDQVVIVDSPAGIMVGLFYGLHDAFLVTQQLCLYTDSRFVPANMPLAETDVSAWVEDRTHLSLTVAISYTVSSIHSKHRIVQDFMKYIEPVEELESM